MCEARGKTPSVCTMCLCKQRFNTERFNTVEAKTGGSGLQTENRNLKRICARSFAGETIKREGEVVGFLTSTAYGHSVGATVGMVSATAAALRIAAQTLSLR
jgi:glycine cleavage system aminomethyltransferase T